MKLATADIQILVVGIEFTMRAEAGQHPSPLPYCPYSLQRGLLPGQPTGLPGNHRLLVRRNDQHRTVDTLVDATAPQ